MIDSYRFGNMIINGIPYDKDILIIKKGVLSPWWRKEGHCLSLEDIHQELQDSRCTHLVVGTGKFGVLRVMENLKTYLKDHGITWIAVPTHSAVPAFNHLLEAGENVMGAFHLTC